MDAQDVPAELDSRLHELECLARLLDDEASAQRAARVRHLLSALAGLCEQQPGVVPAQRTAAQNQ